MGVRVLGGADTLALRALANEDAVANVFILAHLESTGTAAPTSGGASVFGVFDGDTLLGACWAGANLVPVQLEPGLAGYVANAAHQTGRRYASIFGPAETVLALYARFEQLGHVAHEVRAEQPLLSISGGPAIGANPALTFGSMVDFDRILPACAAMFEEEVGYSPFLGGQEFYSKRVAGLIRQGHSLVHIDTSGTVVFKAELGAVTRDVTQVQGVWMNPELRGRGQSAGYMAAVVNLSRTFAPVTSLYVNDYNTKARATYERVGFEQVGTFATVLF
ncbi:N-acetyltransferase GCN5 [Arthrobacter sp. NtRootA4]|nr:ribosomal protein S18 acetylase RimI-like enzyme [Paenarthrobacter nicotinovorans]BCW10196.1 N-acetyltransferase GCN5 [Arthrobacter sp. NtRootA2]BCW14276.1 N-acetyltransferase GCN5 [Arthrobacter sp. NtRootA4]BCW22612.1 N-acetyltransferase GCN5 [Arthrobacter sp. NtRootC7]BCW26881.1 N-acetyltransferase GCN5 [Arthrobacter sp. NtRootC45]BCW31151.1 N-acetyltransferase GCN5 [Arthrobacter sp. NtRootD5]